MFSIVHFFARSFNSIDGFLFEKYHIDCFVYRAILEQHQQGWKTNSSSWKPKSRRLTGLKGKWQLGRVFFMTKNDVFNSWNFPCLKWELFDWVTLVDVVSLSISFKCRLNISQGYSFHFICFPHNASHELWVYVISRETGCYYRQLLTWYPFDWHQKKLDNNTVLCQKPPKNLVKSK